MATNGGDEPKGAAAGRQRGRGAAADRGRARGHAATGRRGQPDHQLEILTAAAIGMAVGVSAVLLLQPSSRRRITPMLRAAARTGRRGAEWARERGRESWGHIAREAGADQMRDYVTSARRAFKRALRRELRELRRTMGRHAR
jgi:hypothetical protein